jgi:putative membrane-bound dehydrogenase-like protein
MPWRTWPLLALFLAVPTAASADHVQLGLRLPPGFEVTEFADSTLANDIYCLTIDPRGRVVVSGRGYLRILGDRDGDGRADQAFPFADGPRDGAQGLLWEGNSLFVTGDGGLRRYRDENGDDRADGPSELLHAMKTGGEHDAHAIKRGPDGWLYVLCGNMTGIDRRFNTRSASLVPEPVAGCVVRFSPDGKEREVFADGFRNAYDMDFNPDGELFTYDSDNERCVSLPWYEPTRFYHVVPGGRYGWLSPQHTQFWRCPPYFPDVIRPLAYLDRGSPTGVVCYRHVQFPPEYRGGFLALDWTFGRVWFLRLERAGTTYRATRQVFIQAVGENGFAPTAATIHPATGDLYLAIGGRGTRGAVYRVRYPAGVKHVERTAVEALQPKSRSVEPAEIAPRVRQSFDDIVRLLSARGTGTQERLAVVRTAQILLGDLGAHDAKGTVWEGYSSRQPALVAAHRDKLAPPLRQLFPAAQPDLDRELTRALAVLEDNDSTLLGRVLDRLTPESDPVEDLHYLIVLARLRAPRASASTERVAAALLALDRKVTARRLHRDRHWPLRVGELYAELCRKDLRLTTAILEHSDFGRPDHALFVPAEGPDRRRAAEVFVARASQVKGFEWSPQLVGLLGELPRERRLPLLRSLWERGGLEEAVLGVLAREPDVADRAKFLEGLRSPELAGVRRSLTALEALPAASDGSSILAVLRALRGLPEGREIANLRQRFGKLLQRMTGGVNLGAEVKPWSEWFAKAHPDLAARSGAQDGIDLASWSKRLAAVDWNVGNAERGREVYTRASCTNCHSGANALGPDLRGVTGRFSRDDLFTAILQPSRDISPRYRALLVETAGGQVHQGVVIYEAVDSLILQTGPTSTVRLADQQIVSRRPTEVSLMPAGLLDKLTDHDLADLLAYLKGLGSK